MRTFVRLVMAAWPLLFAGACASGGDPDSGSDTDSAGDTDSGSGDTDSGGDDTDSGGDTDSDSGGDTAEPGEDIHLVNPSLHNTVLGRPTDHSVAVSVLADAAGDEAYVEVGTALTADHQELAGATVTTATVASAEGEPIVLEVEGLAPGRVYYYRVWYASGGGAFEPDNLHRFATQRAAGSTFHFGVQGDTHPERFRDKMFHEELLALTVAEVRDVQPDFYVMLGDDFSIEKIVEEFVDANFEAGHTFQKDVEGAWSYAECQAELDEPFSREEIVHGVGAPTNYAAYRWLREGFLGEIGASSALFLVNGNHEQAHSANLGGVFNDAAIYAADARLTYYPLPAPDGFYTGDEKVMTSVNGHPTISAPDGLLRDYYAFTWGDALFVTIDPYWHSDLVAPDSSLYDGDKDVDRWAPTMGDAQYAWLRDTLEGSSAKWKFVFAHHVNGDGRGAAALVGTQEWGDDEAEFRANRPGWDKPIHQLFVDTGVTIFFQGHDHLYAREVVDGVVYQTVPNPADNSYFAYNCTAYDPDTVKWSGAEGYGVVDGAAGVVLPDTGFLDVTVSADKVEVAYIRTYREADLDANPNGVFTGTEQSGERAFTYSVPAQPGDDDPADVTTPCIGDEPPDGWVYVP